MLANSVVPIAKPPTASATRLSQTGTSRPRKVAVGRDGSGRTVDPAAEPARGGAAGWREDMVDPSVSSWSSRPALAGAGVDQVQGHVRQVAFRRPP